MLFSNIEMTKNKNFIGIPAKQNLKKKGKWLEIYLKDLSKENLNYIKKNLNAILKSIHISNRYKIKKMFAIT